MVTNFRQNTKFLGNTSKNYTEDSDLEYLSTQYTKLAKSESKQNHRTTKMTTKGLSKHGNLDTRLEYETKEKHTTIRKGKMISRNLTHQIFWV